MRHSYKEFCAFVHTHNNNNNQACHEYNPIFHNLLFFFFLMEIIN